MLIQFSVKNFTSFKDKQVFSMEAGTGDENIENIINVDERILKSTALYGANASGKTNLINFDKSLVIWDWVLYNFFIIKDLLSYMDLWL